jgi:hypothetical protein
VFRVPCVKDAKEIQNQNLLTETEDKQFQWFRHVKKMDRIQIQKGQLYKYLKERDLWRK